MSRLELISNMLSRGSVVLVLDARVHGLSVPVYLSDNPKLSLRFGRSLSPPIDDLMVDDHSISGTLTFGTMTHKCVIPWKSVYAALSETDGERMIWFESLPEEVLMDIAQPIGDLWN